MQQQSVLEVMRRAVRTEICPTCFKREPFEDGTNPIAPRPHEARRCEKNCNIFLNLPTLKKLAQRSERDPSISLEDQILKQVCQYCDADETAGDFCRDRTNRRCPLARYAFDVIEVLERVAKSTKSARSA